ncbi:MAG: DUF2460 domain-containing protein [Bryobacteraceae bacterium]
MRCFPQMAQYPLLRRRRLRTVVNESADGRRVKLADAAAGLTEWRLAFRDLADAEAETLEGFFRECEGRLAPFTFLDPADNLLRWSGKLDESVWEKGPMLTLAADAVDARIWHLQNSGAAAQAMAQTLEAPGTYQYCFSVWVRGAGRVTLGAGELRLEETAGTEWRRLTLAGEPGTGETVRIALELEPGAAVEVFGMQAEAQLGASGYKPTASRGGVYENARFGQDEIRITSTGPDRNECELKIIHGDGF